MNPFSFFETWKIANPFQPSSNGTIYLHKQSRNRRSITVCALIDLLEHLLELRRVMNPHVEDDSEYSLFQGSMLHLVIGSILKRKNGLPKNIFSQT